jgi:peptide-methionine (R)-S-oxide reductase
MSERSASGFDLSPLSSEERHALEAALSEDEADVLLHHGTEAPFCGVFTDNKKAGVYCCKLCALPLFQSGTKFHSGTGWPSFTAPFDKAHLKNIADNSHGMRRVEIRCARCDSHQGHVFTDGPPPSHLRYCINSISLDFVPGGAMLPVRIHRGDPDRAAV